MDHKLEVDVHAHWNDNPPIYRIFVDNELITERTFSWTSYEWYIREHMCCNLDTGVHTLRLENLDTNSRFELEQFKVNNSIVDRNFLTVGENKIEWRFIVDNLLKRF